MSISENVGGMSRYLGGLRTGAGYNDLKKNVADTLERIPVVGGRMIDKIKRTKTVSNSCLSRECSLKIWGSPIWDQWTDTIYLHCARY